MYTRLASTEGEFPSKVKMASMECAGEKPSTSIDAESYITTLKSFIDEQETKIKEKLDKLGWTREYIETNASCCRST